MSIPDTSVITDAEYGHRIALARSILNQREPSEHTAKMAKYALMGVSIDGLMQLDSDR